MKTLLMAGLMLIAINTQAYEDIHNVVQESRTCGFDENQNFNCEFVIGAYLDFLITDVGGRETITLIRKADYEKGKFYLNVSPSHGCLIVGQLGSKLFEGGFAYISPNNAKVYDNPTNCLSGLELLN
ncbi:hypothetical protein [Methylophaga thiooxydans]|uniref:hypothetical protein n=1 Tax=Methylophaga thiooxydans TaxID=392484 RepID=UPI0023521010|nr:hypothetical protein [Methylophaga thiooxydans]